MSNACQRCNGTGWRRPFNPGGGFGLNPGNSVAELVPCPACKGTGQIAAARADAEQEGQA